MVINGQAQEKFAVARAIFRRIRAAFEQHPTATQEFETALQALVETYDTAIHENRFVVGGATEILLCAWIRSLGLNCAPVSQVRTDLVIEEIAFSVKANFAASSTIRLINVLGESPAAHWESPLLVLLAEQGLFYTDPDLVSEEDLRRKPDVLELRTTAIRSLQDSEWHLPIHIPRKPKKRSISPHVASYDVARSILERVSSKVLLEHFP